MITIGSLETMNAGDSILFEIHMDGDEVQLRIGDEDFYFDSRTLDTETRLQGTLGTPLTLGGDLPTMFRTRFRADWNVDITPTIRPPDSVPTSPIPAAAEHILAWIVTPDILDAVLGDMESGFYRIAKRHGHQAATRWYVWQVGRSAGHFAIRKLMHAVRLTAILHRLGLL
jgi:hypothetical protein